MQQIVTITAEADAQEWAREYDIDPAAVPADFRTYLETGDVQGQLNAQKPLGPIITVTKVDFDPDAFLRGFECRQADDEIKRDLELTCIKCGEHVCDVEPGDSLFALVFIARDHQAECPQS